MAPKGSRYTRPSHRQTAKKRRGGPRGVSRRTKGSGKTRRVNNSSSAVQRWFMAAVLLHALLTLGVTCIDSELFLHRSVCEYSATLKRATTMARQLLQAECPTKPGYMLLCPLVPVIKDANLRESMWRWLRWSVTIGDVSDHKVQQCGASAHVNFAVSDLDDCIAALVTHHYFSKADMANNPTIKHVMKQYDCTSEYLWRHLKEREPLLGFWGHADFKHYLDPTMRYDRVLQCHHLLNHWERIHRDIIFIDQKTFYLTLEGKQLKFITVRDARLREKYAGKPTGGGVVINNPINQARGHATCCMSYKPLRHLAHSDSNPGLPCLLHACRASTSTGRFITMQQSAGASVHCTSSCALAPMVMALKQNTR